MFTQSVEGRQFDL